jgi:hypothetical protein
MFTRIIVGNRVSSRRRRYLYLYLDKLSIHFTSALIFEYPRVLVLDLLLYVLLIEIEVE